MARSKKNKKAKKRITTEDYVKANRCGTFEANKDIANLTKSATYKNKKAYTRTKKHKKDWA